MGPRSGAARAAGRLASFALRRVLRRDGAQLPGRVALAVQPRLLSELGGDLRDGAVVVCGTNGKTTTNNVLAAAVEASGRRVACNREGANMAAGVASALLAAPAADLAVLEADELSCIHILPALRPRLLVLLNLFRDQLDRAGEIDHVQDVIVRSLAASPETTLLVCGDDPLSMGVARRAAASGTRVLSFGIAEDLGLPAERVPEARFCQACGAELSYDFRTYAQLGAFRCPACGFSRPALDFSASAVEVGRGGVAFDVAGPDGARGRVSASFGGVYMVYNLLAAFAAASLSGVSADDFRRALNAYHPANGRLQHFVVDGREVVLNLAKNPTGFNQNIAMLLADERPKSVYLVINDDFNDGKDISWIWDMDLERLAADEGVRVLCGGSRANDVQVRCKYAGLPASLAADVGEALAAVSDEPAGRPLYVLCNYSALWPAKAELERVGEAV